MTTTELKEHSLADFMHSATYVESAAVQIELEPGCGHFNVRGDATSELFTSAFEKALGQSLPESQRVTRGKFRIYWLGPAEWLVVSDDANGEKAANQLREALADQHSAVTDVSGGQILLTVSGPAARDLLAKGVTLDLHDRAFVIDQCAQSTLARSGALFALRDNAPTFELVVRRSFADYIARWLHRAGQEFGVSFSEKTP